MKTINDLLAYETFINKHEQVVLIFMSEWCTDCHYLETFLPHIEALYDTIVFAKVDREAVAWLSNHYSIYGVPSFLVYYKGSMINSYINKRRKTFADVKAFLDTLVFQEGRD